MKALFYLVIIIFAALVSIAFTALNPGEVDVNLYLRQVSLPFSVVVVLSIFLGILLGFLASLVAVWSRGLELRKTRKQLKNLQSELSSLRKQPLQEP